MASGAGGIGGWGLLAAAGATTVLAVGGLYYAGVFPPQQPEVTMPAALSTPKVATNPDEPAPESEQRVEDTTQVTAVAEPVPTAPAPDKPLADPIVTKPEPAPAPAEQPAEPVVATPEPAPEPAPVPPLAEPGVDVIRVEPDGSGLVAGTAAPGALVKLMLDGVQIGEIQADDQGRFVSFLTVTPSAAPQVLTLLAELGDQSASSPDQIILAPITQPEIEIATNDQPAEPAPTAVPAPEPAPVTTTVAKPEPDTPEPVQMAQPDTAEETPDRPEPVVQTANTQPAPTQPDQAETAATNPAPKVPEIAQSVTTPAPTPPAAIAPPAVSSDTAPKPAPAPVAVLRASRDGVELLQPATPKQPQTIERIALDTIGYSDGGDVLLSGRAQENAVVRVYLDNAAIADLGADETGKWKGQLNGVQPGVYTLRLDELDDTGRVVSRLETPFKREAPEVLNPPATTATAQTAPIRAVTVQAGDTLWAISRERYGDGVLYVRLFEANRDNIRDPDLIYPGQIFEIPD